VAVVPVPAATISDAVADRLIMNPPVHRLPEPGCLSQEIRLSVQFGAVFALKYTVKDFYRIGSGGKWGSR
jgi:hypothetical protein